jgi:serine/threonine protein kinase
MLVQHESFAVFALDGQCVAKVAQNRASLEREKGIIVQVNEHAPQLVSPAVFECNMETGNVPWSFGFKLERLEMLSVSSEDDVVTVASQGFWRLAVLHELGIVHNDVKPSNLLAAANGDIFICDFGNALFWTCGDEMIDMRGATKVFRVVPNAFCGTDSSMFLCDFEGLYWTILVMWLKVIDERSHWKYLDGKERLLARQTLCSGGIIRGTSDRPVLVLPKNATLQNYLIGQGKSCKSMDPADVLQSYYDMRHKDENVDAWIIRVQEYQRSEHLLLCPASLLRWFFSRKYLRKN